MSQQNIEAIGYVRISTPFQTEEGKESLKTQKDSIRKSARQNGYKLTEIYEVAGISGGTIKARHALLQCLHDHRMTIE